MDSISIEGNKIKWTGEVRAENSFGSWTLGVHKNTIEFFPETEKAWAFAEWTSDSDDEDMYAEIGLRFAGNTLTDYDGVFDLPLPLILLLEYHGYDCEEMKATLGWTQDKEGKWWQNAEIALEDSNGLQAEEINS